jgi:hypothetical protein
MITDPLCDSDASGWVRRTFRGRSWAALGSFLTSNVSIVREGITPNAIGMDLSFRLSLTLPPCKAGGGVVE